MENRIDTALRQTVWMACFPLCLGILASLTVPGAALAASTDTDTIFLASADALNDADMSANRGGTLNITTVTSTQTMNSTSTGNTLTVGGSLTNGKISVGDNFGGSGIGSYVMNTGNNAVINSGVSLSVLMMQ